jgi:hypothetical protein
VEIEVEVLLEEEVFEEEATDDLPKKDNNNLKQNSIFKTTFFKENMYFYGRFKQKTLKQPLIEPLFCPCSAFKQARKKRRRFLPFFFGLILDCF